MCSGGGTRPVACLWKFQIKIVTPTLRQGRVNLNYATYRQKITREQLVFIFLQTNQIVSLSLKYSWYSALERGRKSDFIPHSQLSATSNPAEASTVTPPHVGPEKHDYPTTSISGGAYSVAWWSVCTGCLPCQWVLLVGKDREELWDKEMVADYHDWHSNDTVALLFLAIFPDRKIQQYFRVC